MSLDGTIQNETVIMLSLKGESQQERVFKGEIDLEQVHMIGRWEKENDQKEFEFDLTGKIKGMMDLQFQNWPNIAKRIEINLETMQIYNILDDPKAKA